MFKRFEIVFPNHSELVTTCTLLPHPNPHPHSLSRISFHFSKLPVALSKLSPSTVPWHLICIPRLFCSLLPMLTFVSWNMCPLDLLFRLKCFCATRQRRKICRLNNICFFLHRVFRNAWKLLNRIKCIHTFSSLFILWCFCYF